MFLFPLLVIVMIATGCQKNDLSGIENAEVITTTIQTKTVLYTFPVESEIHEGTWLQWPHQYQYGMQFRNRLDQTWVDMTSALVPTENVHIIAYNNAERTRIQNLLVANGVPTANVNYVISKTNDVWVRDNGPLFVRNNAGDLQLLDFGFNGWGNKAPFSKDNIIPGFIGLNLGLPVVDLNATITTEGGAFEVDGNGVFMATKSSILNSNRNPGMTQTMAENIFAENLGVSKFIWLKGKKGLDITDMHIDGFARFADENTIVTMNEEDLLYWYVPAADIPILYNATKVDGSPFNFIYLPLTQNNVITTWGQNLGYKGSYVNFYTGNNVILVPTYNDPNDTVAINILQSNFPTYNVVGIDVRNLYKYGGMIHCVTQQQPLE